MVFCVEHEQVSFANELLLLIGELHAVLGDGLCRVLEGEQAGGGELAVGQREGFQLCHVGAAQTCGLLCGQFLGEDQVGELTVFAVDALGAQCGHAGGLQPCVSPCLHVAAGHLVEYLQEVVQGGVAPLETLEVHACCFDEGVETDVGDQLLEHGCALCVGDAVEVLRCCFQVGDVSDDGVGGGQLVLHVCPCLAVVREGDPRILKVVSFLSAEGAHEVCEGFLEPQVVPPLHGDEVAEPHVCHFVADGVGAAFEVVLGCAGDEDVVFGEGDQAGVLHCADVVFGHECLLVLGVRVGVVEEVLEEVQAVFGDLEDVVVVEVRLEGLAAVCDQGNVTAVDLALGLVGGGCGEVFAGNDCGDVGGDLCGGGEDSLGDGVVGGVYDLAFEYAVGADDPVLGCGDAEVEDCLQIGLLEVREDSAAVGGLVLGVQVHATVGGVEVAVHTFAGAGVVGATVDGEHVFCLQVGQGDACAVDDVSQGQFGAVELNGVDAVVDVVDEGFCTGGVAGESDGGDGGVGLEFGVLGVSQIDMHVVGVDTDESRTFCGFFAGEVLIIHALYSSRYDRKYGS